MLPDGVLSSTAEFSSPLVPIKTLAPKDLLVAWEMGGVALQDPSQGLQVKVWTLEAIARGDDAGTVDVVISAPGIAQQTLISGVGITEVDLAFDQNMKPAIAYVQSGQAKLWWYDTSIGATATILLPVGAKTPRCTLDDHRFNQSGKSDIILSYINAGNLCYRQQRDRFLTEYALKAVGANAQLVYVAMNLKFRLQFHVHNMTAATDNQTLVASSPFLAEIVLDLCKRAGIPPECVDVSELYDDIVPGYCINNDSGVDQFLKPLSEVYFFDPTEFDRKLHFYKRGRDVVMGISYKDLVATGKASDPMQAKVIDKTKLPRTVSVSYLDPTGGYAQNKQGAERKSNLINTTANQNIQTPIVLKPDDAAGFALKYLKVQWHELMTFVWSLPIGYAALVPGDVFDFFAKDGSTQRIRITSKNEDGNILKFEGKQDGGPDVYQSKATGFALPYPASTTPGLVGATRLEILNIPALRDENDELGVYVAIAGNSSAWYGAQVLFSTDGVNYVEAYRSEVPATLGDTVTELFAEVSAEYPSDQSVIVTSNFDLSSITTDELLNNGNRCVIGDEILQFQTAVYLGSNQWKLSGLVRGRYNTKTDDWPVGSRFVLLDTAITFIQAQQWMLGMELWFKPVSFGLTEDESTPTTYEFSTAYSQWEWAPHHITTERDVSNNVTVNWIPRPRLGIEVAPHNSKYFTGFQVVFSDGFSATVSPTGTTYTRNAAPVGVTAKICGVNSITGNGEFSEEIAT